MRMPDLVLRSRQVPVDFRRQQITHRPELRLLFLVVAPCLRVHAVTHCMPRHQRGDRGCCSNYPTLSFAPSGPRVQPRPLGNSDFVPAVRDLVEDGYKVEVVFWEHVSKELSGIASRFISLNQHLDFLALN